MMILLPFSQGRPKERALLDLVIVNIDLKTFWFNWLVNMDLQSATVGGCGSAIYLWWAGHLVPGLARMRGEGRSAVVLVLLALRV
jgi:hypothetical protein